MFICSFLLNYQKWGNSELSFCIKIIPDFDLNTSLVHTLYITNWLTDYWVPGYNFRIGMGYHKYDPTNKHKFSPDP